MTFKIPGAVIYAIDAAQWPFPFGWGYVALLGNLLASVVCLLAAAAWTYFKVWVPHMKPHLHLTREIHAHLKTHDSFLHEAVADTEGESK